MTASRRRCEAGDTGPGLLAYDGDTPVGWCAVEPRPNLVRLPHSRIVAGGTPDPDFDDPSHLVGHVLRRAAGASASAASGVPSPKPRWSTPVSTEHACSRATPSIPPPGRERPPPISSTAR